MSKITRVGVNGFGRIGRSVFRILEERDDIEIVAINDLFTAEALAYLLQYDTVMGRFPKPVEYEEGALIVDGRKVELTAIRDPAEIGWKKREVDVVIESTGIFRTRATLEKHLQAGAKRVLLTVPPKGDPNIEIDAMIVIGVNDDQLKPEHRIVSTASCTTNCLAPVAKVLHDSFEIKTGIMTTVHAYTNDQRLADVPHKDLRRSRAAAENIIPTTTGAARAVGKILPAIAGKLDGIAVRVPVSDGSVVDLVVQLGKKPSRDDVNAAMKEAADGPLKKILEYSDAPLVSSDIVGNPHSSIFDSKITQARSDGFVRVLSWYDNEWGYSNRCVDMIDKLSALD